MAGWANRRTLSPWREARRSTPSRSCRARPGRWRFCGSADGLLSGGLIDLLTGVSAQLAHRPAARGQNRVGLFYSREDKHSCSDFSMRNRSEKSFCALWQRRKWAWDAVAKASVVVLTDQIPSMNLGSLPAQLRHGLRVGESMFAEICGTDPTSIPSHIDAILTATLLTKLDKMVRYDFAAVIRTDSGISFS